MTMETRNSLVGYWKGRGLMPNAINSYMTSVRTVAKAAYEDKLTKCDDFRHSDFVPKKEEVDNIYLTPEHQRGRETCAAFQVPHHPHTHLGTREGYFHCRLPDRAARVRLFEDMR